MENDSGWKSKKKSRMNIIVGSEENPTQFKGGEVIINKKATKKNIKRLVEINDDGSGKTTTDASDGGLLKGPSHDQGGIPGVVGGTREIETEGEEFVVAKEASEKHWQELSKINQSTGGVPINKPGGFDDDPEEYKEGGKIDFNPNKLPNKNILKYAEKIRTEYPEIWKLGGNIFGNQAYKNLKRVSERGYWKDSEEWMFIKWRSYVARHQRDFRIEGVIAMLKWVDTVDRGWAYMKELINERIKKVESKKKGWKHKTNMKEVGNIPTFDFVSDDFNKELDEKLYKQASEFFSKKVTSQYWHFSTQYFNNSTITYEIYSEKGGFWLNFKIKNAKLDISSAKLIPIDKMKTGGSVAQTPAPKKERIKGSDVNRPESSASTKSASSIKFDESTIESIKNKVKEHNQKHPDKKITLASAKAVVRRGMGAYSSSHRPTISGGKPNSRTAWGLARLNAFTYKIVHGKSKSGKYTQDDDLINELGYSVSKYHLGGLVNLNDFNKKMKTELNKSEYEHKESLDEKRKVIAFLYAHEYYSKNNIIPLAEPDNETSIYWQRVSIKDKEYIIGIDLYFHDFDNRLKITEANVTFYDENYNELKKQDISLKDGGKVKTKSFVVFFKSNVLNNIMYTNIDSDSLENAIKEQQSLYSWSDIEWIKGFEQKSANNLQEFFLQNIKQKWETKPELSVSIKNAKIVFKRNEDSVPFYFTPVFEVKDGVRIFKEGYLEHSTTEIYIDSDFNFDRNKIFELMVLRMKSGGNIEYQSRDLNGTMVYYKRKSGEKWEFISKDEFEKNANEMNTVKFNDGGSTYDSHHFIPANGTLMTKDKRTKLDYKKVGNDYEFSVFDVEPNPVENYTRVQYKKRSDNRALMNYNQFVDYLYNEGYIDDKFKDGGEIDDPNKIVSASSRFRPIETIFFDPALVGPNGNKLISYTWKYQWTVDFNKTKGEEIEKRISDWTQAEESAETGRNIVHAYTIEKPNGEVVTVSSESVPVLMGLVDREQKKVFANLATASKTLAKQQMKLAILEAQEKEYLDAREKLTKSPKPQVEYANLEDLPFVYRKILEDDKDRSIDKIFFKMGDVTTEQYLPMFQSIPVSSLSNPTALNIQASKDTIEQLESNWVSKRLNELGLKVPYGIYDLRNRVERQKRKVENIIATEKMEDGGSVDSKSGIFLNGKELTLVEAIEMYKNDIKELESKERTLSVQREIEALYKTQKILEIKYLTEQLYKTRSETEYKRIEKQINKLKSKYDDGGSVDGKDKVTVDIPLIIRLLELAREDIKSDAELHMVVERLLNLKNKPVLTMDDYAYIAEIEHKHLKKMDLGGNLETERLISQAHTNLTMKRGRRDYAPTTAEIQEEIDRMIMEDQFGSKNI